MRHRTRTTVQEVKSEAEVQPEGSLSFPVAAMRSQLKGLGLPTTGRRDVIWNRLQVAPFNCGSCPVVRGFYI